MLSAAVMLSWVPQWGWWKPRGGIWAGRHWGETWFEEGGIVMWSMYTRFASLSVNCCVPLWKQVSTDLANCLGVRQLLQKAKE